MMAKPLGKLEQVDLREQWPDEARDFTIWLSNEGLELLGEEIGADLILVKREASVGPFSADILAQIDNADEEEHFVLIENQLEKTNHDHLGKIITYASGLAARTVVWVAKQFTEEHRQALDWLNSHTEATLSFFGLEIQLWRIAGSPPAPHFRVVSSPNNWTKLVQQAQRGDPTETKIEQQAFWEELASYMRAKHTFLSLKTPRPQHWYDIALGRSHFGVSLTINTRLNRVGCAVYLSGQQAKQAFDLLQEQKEAIESELGFPLEWQRLDTKKACRIVAHRVGSISDLQQREETKEWMRVTAERLHKVFAGRVAALQLSAVSEEDA
ncbi:MAG TPA: DUF4268 domain-containing protein [Blastocatellia bacterium]|nr:DUF4268 domain-containing protein [Blastocatellia bacterium]